MTERIKTMLIVITICAVMMHAACIIALAERIEKIEKSYLKKDTVDVLRK